MCFTSIFLPLFRIIVLYRFTSLSASAMSESVMSRSSTPFPSRRALGRAIEPAHRTNPAQSAPENPPVCASAARSTIRCPERDRLIDLPKDRSDDAGFPS